LPYSFDKSLGGLFDAEFLLGAMIALKKPDSHPRRLQPRLRWPASPLQCHSGERGHKFKNRI
jgi:hypothetical protein